MSIRTTQGQDHNVSFAGTEFVKDRQHFFDGRDITGGTRQNQRSIFGSCHHPQHLLLTDGEYPSNLGQDVGSPHGIQRDHFNRGRSIVLGHLDIAPVIFNDETSQFLQNRIISRGKQTICRSDGKQLRTLVLGQLVDERTQRPDDVLGSAVFQSEGASPRASVRGNIQQPNRFFKL